ncbi:creatininase family protein [Amycolatopsis acidiphila]|uniref:Creatininase family protein n=1 Tax=Amycolatopsis acidiphila TaxID=715473 RepID=A0A558ACM6_9PSEU|nr:creatininase family protein [Amycolatopsis acidiphila]TVT22022.1 creatininase family protein [Amycolatopsis acidiphila]UIJ63660.1 creatininase family protein [Amycolatopsis acidiphila]
MDLLPFNTTAEIRESEASVAVLPVGSLEQHGAFLPLTTDTVIACTLAREIASAHPVRLLPPITISCSHEHAAWPGTVSITAKTLYSMVTDIADSLRQGGIRHLVLVNGHGGNYVLANVVQESRGAMALFPGLPEWDEARAAAGLETSSDTDMHAGELETSILLHAHPQLVRTGYETADSVAEDRRHLLTVGLAGYTRSGVLGRPSLATAGKGERVLAALVDAFRGHLALFG